LRAIVLHKDLTINGFEHQIVLFENYPIEPIDSAMNMQIIQTYLDSTEFKGMLIEIEFLLDDKDFDSGEPSLNWYEMNKSKIVDMTFKDSTWTTYQFYDKNGLRCYEGPCWRPCTDHE
jgi:hypothetical protein